MPKNVIVVGMARSGTSLTAGVFAGRGYHVGGIGRQQSRDGDTSNPFGYFEADDLIESNVELFRRAGYEHHNTWRYGPISEDQLARIGELSPNEEDRRFVRAYERHSPWLWKDPRLCLTLPFWWKLMDSRTTGVLLVRRNADEIYHSFRRRGWCGAGLSARREVIDRVTQHQQAAMNAVERLSIPHVVVDFADYLKRPERTARRVGEFFGLQLSAADLNVRRELNHSNLRGRISTALRLPLMKLPPDTRRRLQRWIPRRLVGLVFPEWKYVGRDAGKE